MDDFSRLLSRILGEDVELIIDHREEEILVRADPVQLEQVLLNLCTNARQAMPDGGMLRLASRLVPCFVSALVGNAHGTPCSSW